MSDIKIHPETFRNIEQILDAALDDIADAIFARTQELVPVDEATLKKSGHVERAFLKKTIVYDAPHAVYAEYSTKPHMPPLEPILGWVKRKFHVDGQEALDTARHIQWWIRYQGTKEHPYMRPAFYELKGQASEYIKKRLLGHRI